MADALPQSIRDVLADANDTDAYVAQTLVRAFIGSPNGSEPAPIKEMAYVGTRGAIEAWLIRLADIGEVSTLDLKPLAKGVIDRPLWENQTIDLKDGTTVQGIGRSPLHKLSRRVIAPGFPERPRRLTPEEKSMKNALRQRIRRAKASQAKLTALLAEGRKADAQRLVRRVKYGRENRMRGETL
jgi:hypothetical protein